MEQGETECISREQSKKYTGGLGLDPLIMSSSSVEGTTWKVLKIYDSCPFVALEHRPNIYTFSVATRTPPTCRYINEHNLLALLLTRIIKASPSPACMALDNLIHYDMLNDVTLYPTRYAGLQQLSAAPLPAKLATGIYPEGMVGNVTYIYQDVEYDMDVSKNEDHLRTRTPVQVKSPPIFNIRRGWNKVHPILFATPLLAKFPTDTYSEVGLKLRQEGYSSNHRSSKAVNGLGARQESEEPEGPDIPEMPCPTPASPEYPDHPPHPPHPPRPLSSN
ncbi:hypothetical protein B0J17DRAFT_629861 [Rhizoctonia solani]|nr:hypothetical protein B0J17DRAFT_629861 [Rhizoctonia solani]